jgi:hypothetical protein
VTTKPAARAAARPDGAFVTISSTTVYATSGQ